MTRPTTLHNADKIETMITQHFAHLHGVLQNLEKKIIDSLYHQRVSRNDNIDNITSQLKEYEDNLQSALIVIGSVEENLDKIDIQRVIKKLKKVIDIPCHLLTTSESPDEEIRFEVDENIIDTMQKHCTVHIPAVSGFSLQRTELLPDDYEMEPLSESISIPRPRDKSFGGSRSTSLVSLPTKNDIPSDLSSSQVIRVTHVVDPFCFYVQLPHNQNKIMDLHTGLKKLENAPLVASTEVKINGLYAVQSSQNQVWYRGRVVNKETDENDETYTVFFIDYGIQEENVPLTKMRNIEPTFATMPVMVFRCSLDDIVPCGGRWESNAIEAFKKFLNKHDVLSMSVSRVVGDTFYVDICGVSYKGGGVSSAKQALTFMKYATCVSTNKLTRMNPYSTRAYFKEELLIENYTQCEILFVESPSCIYVQKKNACRTQFFKLIRDMMETYKRKDSEDYITTPYKDLPCAALDVDGKWQRGIICEVTENTVKVFFVDLGYSLILCYDSIRTLPKNFLTCRTQAIKVSLRNIKPCNGTKDEWELETIEFLKKHLKTSLSVRVIAWDKFDDTYSVSMQTPDERDVSQLLIKHKLVWSTKTSYNQSMNKTGKNSNKKWKKKDRTRSYVPELVRKDTLEVPEQLVVMSRSFNGQEINTNSTSITELKEKEDPFKVEVQLHQVESPDCIYVSDATCERGNIDKMVQQLQIFYGNYRSADRVGWKEGMVCAVFSSENNMYYRGTIVEIKANDEVVVFLYDEGREDTVPLKDLQSLYPPFFKVPAYGFKIKLAGILPCGGSKKWPSLSCEVLKEILSNYSCKFYISKLEEEDVKDSAIPVELWIKQNRVDGPLFPTRIEINSVNRMLVEKGVALPVKEYAKKRDKILATELKKQLTKKLERLTKNKSNGKWLKINENCPNETNTNGEPTSYLRYSDSSSEFSEECNPEEQFDDIPSLPTLSAWLPNKGISANKFIAMPTYLDHNGFLYLHSTEQSTGILSDIEKKLEQLYTNCTLESCDTVWSIGDMCIAQYHGNKKWYRGKVMKILENDVVEVEFVDYGNHEECPIGTLKKHVVLENVPIQCTKCLIYRLEPDNETGKWTTSELDRIHSFIIDKKCIVSVLDRTDLFYVISINIFSNEQENTTRDLISFLINDCGFNIKPDMSDVSDVAIETSNMLSSYEEAEKSIDSVELKSDKIINGFSTVLQQTFSVDNNDDCSIDTTDVENLSWSEGKKNLVTSTPYVVSEETLFIGYQTITMPQDIEYIQIELCSSIAPTKFYAQMKENTHSTILNECYNQYKKIMEDLQENASKQPMITTITPDTPCCAKFVDNVWYRCSITTVDTVEGSDNVQVNLFYVDYGNSESRTINPQKSELYSLKKEWLHTPTLAIKCKLWNVEISTSADVNLIYPKIGQMYDKLVIATVKETDKEYMSIELYENEDRKELLYSSLINEGLLKVIAEE